MCLCPTNRTVNVFAESLTKLHKMRLKCLSGKKKTALKQGGRDDRVSVSISVLLISERVFVGMLAFLRLDPHNDHRSYRSKQENEIA